MARYILLDYEKAMAAMIAEANTADEQSAVESIPATQTLPHRVAVIRTSAIEEFFVVDAKIVDESPTLVVRGADVVNSKTPPDAPTQLTASMDGPYVHLAWQGTTPMYMVFRNGELRAILPRPYFLDDGLTTGNDYTYDVHAMDAARLKSKPASVTITA